MGIGTHRTAIHSPLYQQVRRLILDRITAGEWHAGDRLPPENILASETGVSIGTLRRAVEMLVSEGVLERRQGAGTYLRTFQRGGYANRFQPFESVNGAPRFDRKVLRCFERCPAPAEAAAGLGLREGEPVIRIVRHMLKDDEGGTRIAAIDELFLPPAVFPSLTEALFRTRFSPEDSLYRFYDRELGVIIVSQKCAVRAETLRGEAASALFSPDPMTVLRFSRISMTYGRKPVEYRIYRMESDNSQVVFDLA